MKVIFFVLLSFIALQAKAQGTRIIAGQSDEDVALELNFNGREILIFGAIDSDVEREHGVIIVVNGPERNTIVTRKEKKFGLWLGGESEVIANVPAYYGVISNRPIAELLSEKVLVARRIGYRSHLHYALKDEEERQFVEGLVRNKVRFGQYHLGESDVVLQSNLLFSGRIPLPANIIEGIYDVRIFVTDGQDIVAFHRSQIDVHTTGIDAWIYNLSQKNGLLYGIIAVAMAMFAAFLAGSLASLLRR